MSWLTEAEYAIATAVCWCAGLDPSTRKAADFVRYTYRDDGTSPQPPRTKNVCYITTSITGSPGLADPIKKTDTTTWYSKTIPLEVLLTYYGPDAVENAEAARTGMVVQLGYDSPLSIFKRANLALVFPIQPTVYAPEIEDGNWRKRCDLRLNMVLTQIVEYRRPDIELPLDILLAATVPPVVEREITVSNTPDSATN